MIKPVWFFFLPHFYFSVIVKLLKDTKASLLVEAERAIRYWELNMVKQEGSSQSQLWKSMGSLREFRYIKLLWNIPWSHEEYLKTAINPKDDDQLGRISGYLNEILGTIWQNLEQKRKKDVFFSWRDFKPP